MDCSTPGLPVHHQLPELAQTQSITSVMPSNHLILCRPLLLPPSICPRIRVFSYELDLYTRWSKYWSFSFRIGPSHEHSGLISLRMEWLDLLAVQVPWKRDHEVQEILCIQRSALVSGFQRVFTRCFTLSSLPGQCCVRGCEHQSSSRKPTRRVSSFNSPLQRGSYLRRSCPPPAHILSLGVVRRDRSPLSGPWEMGVAALPHRLPAAPTNVYFSTQGEES